VDDIVEGGMFGVSSLTGLERYILEAECAKDSEVLKIEINVLRRILDDNPVVGYAIQQRGSQIFFKRYVNAMEMIGVGAT
jgi:CRP-like cAMP-binding protein